MFDVISRNGGIVRTVYAVRNTNGFDSFTEFLIFIDNTVTGWMWVYANDYNPIRKGEQNERYAKN